MLSNVLVFAIFLPMSIQKSDLKQFFRTNREIAEVMGTSKQWVDITDEIKNEEHQERLKAKVRERMREIVESYARVTGQ